MLILRLQWQSLPLHAMHECACMALTVSESDGKNAGMKEVYAFMACRVNHRPTNIYPVGLTLRLWLINEKKSCPVFMANAKIDNNKTKLSCDWQRFIRCTRKINKNYMK